MNFNCYLRVINMTERVLHDTPFRSKEATGAGMDVGDFYWFRPENKQ